MITIGVLGANGKMGRWVCNLIQEEFISDAQVFSRVSRHKPLFPLLTTDIVIDFSSPQAMTDLAKLALHHHDKLPAFVVGSTGWDNGVYLQNKKILEELSLKTPILLASNFSMGVFIVSQILKNFAPLLHSLKYTPVIIETHHQHKKDAPSGTAISFQRAITPQSPEKIQTHSIRAEEIIGQHEVKFFGKADEITISHIAHDRSIFARGAIQAAIWLAKERQKNHLNRGILSMDAYYTAMITQPGEQA